MCSYISRGEVLFIFDRFYRAPDSPFQFMHSKLLDLLSGLILFVLILMLLHSFSYIGIFIRSHTQVSSFVLFSQVSSFVCMSLVPTRESDYVKRLQSFSSYETSCLFAVHSTYSRPYSRNSFQTCFETVFTCSYLLLRSSLERKEDSK